MYKPTVEKGSYVYHCFGNALVNPIAIVPFPVRKRVAPLRVFGHVTSLAKAKAYVIESLRYNGGKIQEIIAYHLALFIGFILVN